MGVEGLRFHKVLVPRGWEAVKPCWGDGWGAGTTYDRMDGSPMPLMQGQISWVIPTSTLNR